MLVRGPPIPLHPNTDVNAEANLHQLCDERLYMARNSQTIRHQVVGSISEFPELKETFIHHGTARALESAMQQGCHLCTLIFKSIEDILMHAMESAEWERAKRDQDQMSHIGVSELLYKLEIQAINLYGNFDLSLIVKGDEIVEQKWARFSKKLQIRRYDGLSMSSL